jgi:hypothetical protein
MIAYKFLCAGAVGPFSRYAWPLPRDGAAGAWVAGADPGAVLCHAAVHACRIRDLPWWLHDELWEAELDGAVTAGRHKVMAPRGRLRRRVEGWDAACAQRFADACAERTRDHAARALERAGESALAAELRSATTPGELRDRVAEVEPPEAARVAVTMAGDAARRALGGAAVVTAYIAAHAAATVSGPAALDAERAWQSEWLRAALSLPPDPTGTRTAHGTA